MTIPFNKPYLSGKELINIKDVLSTGRLSGNNTYSRKVIQEIEKKYPGSGIFLTPSASAALEMGILLSDLKPGDEVIMPSFTFSSTANAVMIFGARPVFCEVEPGTMNLDPDKVEALLTERTRMIIPIDYGGIPCDQDSLLRIAKKYNLIIMLDGAQSYGSTYKHGSTGENCDLVCFSFHETKNITCGEGGALVVNRKDWLERATYVQEKGTNRSKAMKGIIDKYSWISLGSSYLLSDVLAAILLAQLEEERLIIERRKKIFDTYFDLLKPWHWKGLVKVPQIPQDCESNYHSFWIIFDNEPNKEAFIDGVSARGISAYTSYVPLHSAKMGLELGYKKGDLPLTETTAAKLVRLPVYPQLLDEELNYCCKQIVAVMKEIYEVSP